MNYSLKRQQITMVRFSFIHCILFINCIEVLHFNKNIIYLDAQIIYEDLLVDPLARESLDDIYVRQLEPNSMVNKQGTLT